jgi:DNA-binding response OmpR family regulator
LTRVLVVEDDDAIAESLSELLRREGFEVALAGSARSALEQAPSDLVLLDLGLPDADGQELCRSLRQRSTVPIIVITARGAEDDRVTTLETGADDYVVKPYGSRELVARIRAVLRRTAAGAGNGDSGPARVGAATSPQLIGTLEIDRRTRKVRVGGSEVACTPKEFGILAVLAEDPGALVTRQQLLDEVWGPHWYGPTKMIDVHVASLRKKLGRPEWVETVWGVGFRLEVEASAED